MEHGSWTNSISRVRGYDDILIPMERTSAQFHDRVLARDVRSFDSGSRNALFHLVASEPSCYRDWGEGVWTDYGGELARCATATRGHDL